MKLPETHDHLDQSLYLLSSLSTSIPAVQSFRGRWSAVAATLDDLRSSLSSLSDIPNLTSNPLSSDLLISLSQTLSLTVTLALHCQSPDPPAGKLRTQSDLASVSAELSRLAADAELLLRSGLLLDPPPPQEATATAAARRTEARNLVTRLQIGISESRIAALDSLILLLREDDKNVLIAAAQGVVPALIRLLDSSSSSCHETKEKAVTAIARVSSVESCRHVLLGEGASLLHHLARVLESEGGLAKEKACAALQTLTLARDNAVAFSSRGGISSLLEICLSGTPSSQAAAAGVLKNLSGVQEVRQNFLEENAIPILVRVLASGTVLAQENAVACLCNLAAGEEGHQTLKISIFKEGGLDCLKNYWGGGGDGDRNLEPAIRLLRNLASLKYISEIIQSSEFLPRVIAALDSSSVGTRTEAARAVSELASGGKLKKEFGEAVPRLVRMLGAKGSEEKAAAVKALDSVLVCNGGNRRLFRKEEKGIVNVVMLLDPLVRNVEMKHPVSVLLAVSQSRRCRKQMVAVGACGLLKRLVGMEVEGAKKLLESLEGGKIWGVFPRT